MPNSIFRPKCALHDFGRHDSGRKIAIWVVLPKLWANRAPRLVNGFAWNPRQNFGNFVNISIFSIFFCFLTIFRRVWYPNVAGSFGWSRKIRKIMVLEGYGKDINFFLKKNWNFFFDSRFGGPKHLRTIVTYCGDLKTMSKSDFGPTDALSRFRHML